MTDSSYAVLRSFNRTWTQRVGALDESFLGSGRPLGLSRLLFEVGPDGAEVRTLRRRLGLDSGYVSRQLGSLVAEGLVEVAPDPTDRRRRRVTLTAAGQREWRRLEDRSERRAASLVAELTPRQRARLDEALSTAQLLVRAATIGFEPVPADSPEAREAVGRYFAELDERFEGGFDPGDAWDHDAASLAPPEGAFLLARSDDDVVACGGVQRIGPGVGEIKRMWVHPGWRGAGLGTRTLRRLEEAARELGHDRVRLDTNDALVEAVSMYERSGYVAIPPYNDNPYARHWFEKSLAPGEG
ncbi:MAG: helix-turn-helix domain-containing GNAT family N-acetyltransferase [Nocardioidaceae bacterium]|mgnify:CR=1 FL=1